MKFGERGNGNLLSEGPRRAFCQFRYGNNYSAALEFAPVTWERFSRRSLLKFSVVSNELKIPQQSIWPCSAERRGRTSDCDVRDGADSQIYQRTNVVERIVKCLFRH
ncbi:hypothetical protein EVAR_14083_1 [Eumeta japonica]|uniref:Uncharacterized protein n=1 Tax=Eumeta variegata TaxID=151549 RepID=A0A4C1UPX7_EUMVA|nr:hypothetical protein EVAR_14083_1 [Eumeta japonica]